MSLGWLIAFYGASAAAVVLLFVRYLRRKRRERSAGSVSPGTASPQAGSKKGVRPPDFKGSDPFFAGESADEPAEPAGTGVDPAPPEPAAGVPAPHARPAASAVRSASAVTWEGRRLFVPFQGELPDDDPVPRVEADQVPTTSPDDYAFGALTPALAALLPESETRREITKRELRTAGYYQPHAVQNLAAIRYVGIMLPLILIGLLLVLSPAQVEPFLVMMLVAVPLCGWALPRLYVRSKAVDRTSRIERGLPDMFDMLNMCVSQGLTVPESLQRISRELRPVYPALAQELSIVSEQAEVGTLRHALENFAGRIDSPDVHSFTSLLTQTERMGTSVSEALVDYSDAMRENLRQRADEKANQAAFKILFPTALCLMPAVFMFLMGPAMIELSDFFTQGGSDVLDQTTEAVEQIPRFGQPRQ